MGSYLRERWTEDAVLALPVGEHDYFERKSGALVQDSDFRLDFAKALSAIANSGGGHVLLGVRDDGDLDGVDPMRGRTKTREWLEQLVPELLADPLKHFRVHTVERAVPSKMPSGRDVIVVDVDDSPHAPHQVRANCIYYYRAGGHSKPAPHFYLDALRRRFVGPLLATQLQHIRPIGVIRVTQGLFVQLRVRFTVRNEGRTAASKWSVAMEFTNVPRGAEQSFKTKDFPRWSFEIGEPLIKRDQTLFPTFERTTDVIIGLLLDPQDETPEQIAGSIDKLVTNNVSLRYFGVSEYPPTESQELDLKPLLPSDLSEQIGWFLPGKDFEGTTFKVGRDIFCSMVQLEGAHQAGSYREFEGEVENRSNDDFAELTVGARFYNKEGKVICLEKINIERLPPNCRKRFKENVRSADVASVDHVDFLILNCVGRHSDGSRFSSPFDY